jgi:hypothetical protein
MFMKKILISFCAASLLAASAISYASSVTFVNEYRQPVNFAASSGYVYNPVAQGTILPGGHFTFQVNGPITPDYNFMAYVPSGSNVVTGCGYIGQTVGDVTVKAGWSNETGKFGCWVFPTPMHVKHACNKNKQQKTVVYSNNTSNGYYNNRGVVYSNNYSDGYYNNNGVIYSKEW